MTELAIAATPDDVDNVTPKDDVSNVIQLQPAAGCAAAAHV